MLNPVELGTLPTGTVTVLLAVVADSTRLREADPERFAAATGRLDRTLADTIAAHGGVRPGEQREADACVAAFARASDAVACAVALQRAPLAPIRLRIGVYAGDVQPAEHGSYAAPVIARAGRLCDLAHGGQTVLSKATAELAADRLLPHAWLTDLGTCAVPGPPHLEWVIQLCHPDLVNDFPPLRTREALAGRHFPVQLTSFVGRQTELRELRRLVCDNRLVTLTGAGGAGKTRLALQLASQLLDRFTDGAWCVDLAPITDPDLVAVRVAHTLGLFDQPGDSAMDTLIRFLRSRRSLVVLDNCEHLLDACAALVTALLGACLDLTILATSREPIGAAGEATWLTPSLSLGDEAVELFTRRAQLVRPSLAITGDNATIVTEICRRLDGMPLAIELAATRVRALSLTEIAHGLQDRFRLLTGGARTVVPRQQTLRASVDWSYTLLSEPERVMFRRLAVFLGGFDLDAARAVAGDPGWPRYRTVEQLALLVDKSLLLADNAQPITRYRLLETLREYALEKLDESGESDSVRVRHRDYYTALVEASAVTGHQQRVEQADMEIDNLRAAFAWSQEHGDVELASRLASALQPLWMRGRILEGLAWFDAVLAGGEPVPQTARVRALADKTMLETLTGVYHQHEQAEQALAIARDLGDPALLAWTLTACGFTCCYRPEVALPYLAEAVSHAPALGDDWRLCQIFGVQAYSAFVAGDLTAVRPPAEQGRDLAEAIGDGTVSRQCRWCLGLTQWLTADLAGAAAQFSEVAAEAEAAHDPMFSACGLMLLAIVRAHQGDTTGARAAGEAGVKAATGLGAFQRATSLGALVDAFLAAGEVGPATSAADAAWRACGLPEMLAVNGNPIAKAALAGGDLSGARRWADQAVSTARGVHRMVSLAVRVRVAIAQDDVEQAERDAHAALDIADEAKAYLMVPDVIECLAMLHAGSGGHRIAAWLLGSAQAIRKRTGQTRFKIYHADYADAVTGLRKKLGRNEFDAEFAGGADASVSDAIAYARRSAGNRKRPSTGWAALTPAEQDIVGLVGQGLSTKDIAARLYVSVRTVQTHLTHVYSKLGVSSRVQLAQQARRRR